MDRAAHDASAKMEEEEDEEEEEEEESLPGCTLFIKNLNFDTTEETLKGVSDFLAQREWVGGGTSGLVIHPCGPCICLPLPTPSPGSETCGSV